jgi:hypothetical protein
MNGFVEQLFGLLFIVIGGLLIWYMPKIKGILGEKSVAIILLSLDPKKYIVMHDLLIHSGGKTSQIDHVVVSNYGIFVIETKNYKGWIVGKEFDDQWTQVIYRHKERLRNPIKQNFGHIQALKETLSSFGDIPYISIVAFTLKATLKVRTNSNVVYTVNLPRTIGRYKNESISDEVKERIRQTLTSANIDDKEARKDHIRSIRNDLSDTSTKIHMNVCPKCGSGLVMRNGRYGPFKGCSNFPRCKFIAK